MLTVSPSQIAHALEHLDPVDRAMLDLSLRRGVDDDVIAEMLRIDRDGVERWRSELIDQLASELGLTTSRARHELQALIAEPSGGSPPEAVPADPVLERSSDRGRGGGGAVLLLVLVILGAAAVGILLSLGGDDEGDANKGAGPRAKVSPARAVDLQPIVPGGGGRAHARVIREAGEDELQLSVSGLPPLEEPYEVWLYNSVSDARSVGRHVGGRFRLRRRLPKDYARYRFLDVSHELLDDNPNHSGESLLRAPTTALFRGSATR